MARLDSASEGYIRQHLCAAQWRAFLPCLAASLEARMSIEELRRLMSEAGARLAEENPPADGDSLKGLETCFNALWSRLEWGVAEVRETDDYLSVIHRCAPLRAAFGSGALAWSTAVLEGAYGQWFDVIGAGNELILKQVTEPDGLDDAVEFRLGQMHVVGPAAADLVFEKSR